MKMKWQENTAIRRIRPTAGTKNPLHLSLASPQSSRNVLWISRKQTYKSSRTDIRRRWRRRRRLFFLSPAPCDDTVPKVRSPPLGLRKDATVTKISGLKSQPSGGKLHHSLCRAGWPSSSKWVAGHLSRILRLTRIQKHSNERSKMNWWKSVAKREKSTPASVVAHKKKEGRKEGSKEGAILEASCWLSGREKMNMGTFWLRL